MQHLSQQQIDMKVRRPHLQRWKKEMTTALRNPALPAEHRADLRLKLKKLGKPKTYRADGPVPLDAIDPGPMPKPEPNFDFDFEITVESLAKTPRGVLLRFAEKNKLDLETAHTKAQVIEAILNQQGAFSHE